MEGVCRARNEPDDIDAGVDPTGIDATRTIDAPIDRPVDGALTGVQTLTFGESSSADVRNVTTDTWISDHFPNQVHGADAELLIESSPPTAALIQFDLRAIPASATIESAAITWTVFDAVTEVETVSAQVLQVPWSEASANWFQASSTVPWPADGAQGDAVNAEPIIDGFNPRSAGTFTLALPATVVQAWVADPASNHGLRWQATGVDLLRMRSREASDAERPLLSVTFRSP